MPKLLSSTQVVKVLKAEGFIFISQRGSHAKFRKGSATGHSTNGQKRNASWNSAIYNPPIRLK